MRQLFQLVCIVVVISGCTNQQYLRFSSYLPAQNDGSFLFENDSIKIIYSFLDKGHLQLEITNKLDDLIHIDLKKSALVINNQSYSYYDGAINFSGRSIDYNHGINQQSEFNGTGYIPTNEKYIHPHTKIIQTFENVPICYEGKAMDRYVKRPTQGAEKTYFFNQENTSHYLENSLYIKTDEKESELFVLRHSFWVSEYQKTIAKDKTLRNNQFHSTQITPFGIFVGGAAVSGLIILFNYNAKKSLREIRQ